MSPPESYSDRALGIEKPISHFVFVARHTGEFAGVAPQDNTIRLPAISTFRIVGSKLAEA